MTLYIIAWFTILYGFFFNIFLYKVVTGKRIHIKIINIFVYIFLTFVLTLLTFTDELLLKITFNIISTISLISLFYKEDILKSFYYSFFIWIASMISELIVSIFIINSGSNYYEIYDNSLIRSLIIFPISFMQYFLIKLNKKILNNIYYKYYLKIENNFYFICSIIFLIFLLTFLSCINAYQSNYIINSIFTIFIIIILLVLIIFLVKYIIKAYNLSNINQNIINENVLIREISKNDQIFRHNLLNDLLGIELVANKKTKILIEDLIKNYKKDYNTFNNINELPQGIQGLIYKKIYLANIESLNVVVQCNFKENVENMMTSKKYILLVETLGILIDNAIDAVKICKNKIIMINVEKKDKSLCIEIKNSFNNILDLEKIGTLNYTSKVKGHGIGLNYLMKNNIKIKVQIINDLFSISTIMDI